MKFVRERAKKNRVRVSPSLSASLIVSPPENVHGLSACVAMAGEGAKEQEAQVGESSSSMLSEN